MKRRPLAVILFISVFLLVACSSEPVTPTEILVPTVAVVPTSTMEPTPPDPTPFFDDFEGSLDPSWSWINEDPERWRLTDESWLEITAANPGFVAGDDGIIREVNVLARPAPEGSFTLTTRLFSSPDENFQQAGIFVFQDGFNYVAMLSAFCEPCLPEIGSGFFMEAFKNNEYVSGGMWDRRDIALTDVYLRLVYDAEAKTVTGFAGRQPDAWQQIGVIDGFDSVAQIGLGAANAPNPEGQQENLTAAYAYIEISSEDTPVQSGDPLPPVPMPPEPSPTAEPTATPEPTPLPAGLLFRDDFDGYLQPGWAWINEDPERWTFTQEGWLEIQAGDIAFYSEGGFGLVNFLTRELPEGEFMITAHVKADPIEDFQQATIYIFEDQDNYVALNIGFCQPCAVGGPGFFMETFIDNNPFENAYMIARDPAVTDVYLRLVNQGGSITGYYATEYGDWQRVGAFGNYFDFKLVGLGTTNSNPNGLENDIISQFDYFEIAEPE